jgi:hypothetical protein
MWFPRNDRQFIIHCDSLWFGIENWVPLILSKSILVFLDGALDIIDLFKGFFY